MSSDICKVLLDFGGIFSRYTYSMKNLLLSVVVIVAIVGGTVFVIQDILPHFKTETGRNEISGQIYTQASDVSSCRTIAFGSKACGGPQSYIVYSVETTNEEKLRSLVETYNAEEKARNQQTGAVSDCSLVQPPELDLIAGHCVAKK
jgi:hypothetical protein